MKGMFLNALTVVSCIGFGCSSPETGIIPNQGGTGGSGMSPLAGSGGAALPSGGGGGGASAGMAGTSGSAEITAGSAGVSMGGGGSNGQAGQAGSGGAAVSCCAGGDCKDCISNMDGWLTKSECGMSQVNHDCDLPACTNNTKTFNANFALSGAAADPAKNFFVTFNVRGVVECKTYNGGMNRIGNNATQSPTGVNLFYEGGTVPGSSYNTHELHVQPKNDAGPSDWYLKCLPHWLRRTTLHVGARLRGNDPGQRRKHYPVPVVRLELSRNSKLRSGRGAGHELHWQAVGRAAGRNAAG